MPRRASFLALGLAAFFGQAALGPPAAAFQTPSFSGTVTDQGGRPVNRATVEVNGKRTLTRDDGRFQLEVPADRRYLLNISHPDFAEFSHVSRTPLSGQNWRLVRAQIETVDASRAIALRDTRPELKARQMKGARIELAANSLVDAAGRPPAGPVRAAIATLDVSNGEGPGDWAVRDARGREGYLVSYGAVYVQFTDAGARVKYQLRAGRSARVLLPVVPSMSRHAPDAPRAPFWYYDLKDGYWKRAGAARLDRNAMAYAGSVNHLSTINTDIAKFDNAACLAVTLDPSVAAGLKLRIRYHSGGTPFGQTPTFVMNDPVNAAYRLPANTNVLLELLDASDAVFGDLVVEDPAGTPLVNTVVDTGPPIPPGNSLWPSPPYTDCKAILIRRAVPQVEIRINEQTADPAPRDNPTDDYLSWAPTFAMARLNPAMGADVNVVLTNDSPNKGGDVVFAAHVAPWPANTTATANTLALTLPAAGGWVPFVVAGKFGTPSINDKDAIIEAHQGTAAGAILGRKALMVRVRKNANSLQPSERARFLFAWRNFRNKLGDNYVLFQEMHRLVSTAGDEGHNQPAFLPWHRAMLLHVERELQEIVRSVALHYWNWDAAAP
jgi:hypothetical protein